MNRKVISKGKMWCFAIGQFGWSLLSALITNWLVYFYQPDPGTGIDYLIPQGKVILGIITIIGGITALGRIFDAVTDPWIANLSDRSTNPHGRRIPFMRKIAVPFAIVTVLVFWAPFGSPAANSFWLLVTLLLFYLFMTTYCTPYNALISELGATQDTRISISTYISCTFLLGSAIGYAAPYIWGALEGPLGSKMLAMRVTFVILAVIGLIALLVPTFTIKETDYIDVKPTCDDAFRSLGKTFRSKNFRIFVGSDVLYFVALTIFQTGLPFFITTLMKLPETMTTILYVAMTLLSFACYPLVNFLAHKLNKKRLVLFGFCGLSCAYIITSISGLFGVPGMAWGVLVVIVAAFPMAILGILPQAIVADIAQADAIVTGEKREGMFFAARTFAFKMGQAVSMLLFTSFKTISPETGLGLRIAAITSVVICLIGAAVLSRYNEKKILGIIVPEEK